MIRSACVLTASLLLLAAPALAQPTPSDVYITHIDYAGTGCPAGTVAGSISTDLTAFNLIFDSFVAEAGPGVPMLQSRKNCQLNVHMHIPQGWSLTVNTVDFRGYAQLADKVVGTQRSTYYFGGSLQQVSAETILTGELEEDYVIRDVVPVFQQVWSACGINRPLNINTQVKVNNSKNPSGYGMMTTDSIDGQVQQVYSLSWKPCP
jgi:hypothetical protein